MTEDLQSILDTLLRTDLNAFVDKAMMQLMGAQGYLPNWHIRAMTAALQRMIDGENRFLIILVPPRMGKSLICSVALPAFLLVQDPSCKIMALSYASVLGTKLHNLTRNVLKSGWCRRLNNKLKFTAKRDDQVLRDSDIVLETTMGGHRYAPSFGGSIRGEGADWIIMDDPMGTTAASSEAERKKAVETFREAIRSRLNSKTGRIVLVMQRVHFHDLAGYLIEQGGYEVLRIPAIAEEDVNYDLGGGQSYFHPKGSLIDPRRFDMLELELLRRDMGSETFECQYGQRPRLPDGQIIKLNWLKFVDVVPDFERVFVSADIAGSDERGDYSVFLVWGVRDGIWYVTHIYRQRWEFVELIKLVQRIDRDHEPGLILVERNGLGASFLSRAKELGLSNVDAMNVKMSKTDRAFAVTPLLEQGKVSSLRTIPTFETFLEELLSFPSSRFVDQVDAFTLPLHRHLDVTRVLRDPVWIRRENARHQPQHSGPSASISSVHRCRVGGTYFDRNRDNPLLG